ncbi:hypothetical protein NW762_014082 [Fusarium torreyae]|uniref:Methyltransferase domain-containing protein n=1 Tax=Fusarium torreyae TaxID=1237075 RepID=A0A9W8RM80_9HYPO|nr:hypothetical protein NW762_014082 [Fusarium torreyae]
MTSTTDTHNRDVKTLGEKNKEHFDRVAAEVFKYPWILRLCNEVSEELRQNIDWIGVSAKQDESRMLDYACGNGVASRISVIRGIDISSKMVEQYNMLAEAAGFAPDKMRAVHGDLMNPETTPSPELNTPEFNNFDLVVLCMALHHVEDYAGMIKKLSERLSPNEVLLIVDWVAPSESGCSEPPKFREASNGTASSKMGFTEMEVKTAFEQAGMVDWRWKWCSGRTELPEEIGGEQQGFFARGQTADNK